MMIFAVTNRMMCGGGDDDEILGGAGTDTAVGGLGDDECEAETTTCEEIELTTDPPSLCIDDPEDTSI